MRGEVAQHIGGQPKPSVNVQSEVLVNETTRKVGLHFWPKIDNLQMDAPTAVAMARAMLEGAKRLDPASVEGLTW